VHVLPPLPRHGLKRVSGGQLLPGMLLEAVGYRVDPLRQQSPRLVPIGAGLGKADIGVDAQRHHALFGLPPVVDAQPEAEMPVASALVDEEEQPVPIVFAIGVILEFRYSHRRVGELVLS